MEQKTKIHAEEGGQDIIITREFDLPVELLFRAHTDAAIIAQWMGTKVLKFENTKHGSWALETSDSHGKIIVKMHGTIHDFVPNRKITRTFQIEMEGFDAQLDYLEFEALTDSTSRLTMQSVYRSPEHRARQLKLPFAYGINMAHDRLEEIVSKLNK